MKTYVFVVAGTNTCWIIYWSLTKPSEIEVWANSVCQKAILCHKQWVLSFVNLSFWKVALHPVLTMTDTNIFQRLKSIIYWIQLFHSAIRPTALLIIWNYFRFSSCASSSMSKTSATFWKRPYPGQNVAQIKMACRYSYPNHSHALFNTYLPICLSSLSITIAIIHTFSWSLNSPV